jgi:hypothetical protein
MRKAIVRTIAVLAGAYVAFGLAVYGMMHASNPVTGKTLSLVGAPAFILLPMAGRWSCSSAATPARPSGARCPPC